MKKLLLILTLFFPGLLCAQTYAELLGYPKNAKVLILHIDDVGMSFDSNKGAIEAMENGVATSLSMMMPCPWIPGFFKYLKTHPNVDAGLHLTLTSEWDNYRWGPLSGKPKVPGLVDTEGAMWDNVAGTVKNATPDEIEIEIRAQLERSRAMGWEPTHLDSHMGTLFESRFFGTLPKSRHGRKNTCDVSGWTQYHDKRDHSKYRINTSNNHSNRQTTLECGFAST